MDNDVQDTGSAPAAPDDDRRSRRRLLGAGLIGLAGSVLPQLAGRAGAVPDDTENGDGTDDQTSGSAVDNNQGAPPSNPPSGNPPLDTGVVAPAQPAGGPSTSTGGPTAATTPPPLRPTAEDEELLKFAQTVELAAVDLYDTAIASGSVDESRALFVTLREAHLSYSHTIAAQIGKIAPDEALTSMVDEMSAAFGGSTDEIIEAARSLEGTAVATHESLIGQLVGTDGSAMIASILVAEARHGTVLADLAGARDLDSLLTSDATALAPTKG